MNVGVGPRCLYLGEFPYRIVDFIGSGVIIHNEDYCGLHARSFELLNFAEVLLDECLQVRSPALQLQNAARTCFYRLQYANVQRNFLISSHSCKFRIVNSQTPNRMKEVNIVGLPLADENRQRGGIEILKHQESPIQFFLGSQRDLGLARIRLRLNLKIVVVHCVDVTEYSMQLSQSPFHGCRRYDAIGIRDRFDMLESSRLEQF